MSDANSADVEYPVDPPSDQSFGSQKSHDFCYDGPTWQSKMDAALARGGWLNDHVRLNCDSFKETEWECSTTKCRQTLGSHIGFASKRHQRVRCAPPQTPYARATRAGLRHRR